MAQKIIVKYFLTFVENMILYIQKTYLKKKNTSIRISTKKTIPRHIIVKLLKTKDKVKILKAPGGGGWWWEDLIYKIPLSRSLSRKEMNVKR